MRKIKRWLKFLVLFNCNLKWLKIGGAGPSGPQWYDATASSIVTFANTEHGTVCCVLSLSRLHFGQIIFEILWFFVLAVLSTQKQKSWWYEVHAVPSIGLNLSKKVLMTSLCDVLK